MSSRLDGAGRTPVAMQGSVALAGEQTTTKEETMINQKVGYVTPGKFFPTQQELNLQAQNKAVLMSGEFADACKAAGIPETKLQASKFKNKRGLAYRFA